MAGHDGGSGRPRGTSQVGGTEAKLVVGIRKISNGTPRLRRLVTTSEVKESLREKA